MIVAMRLRHLALLFAAVTLDGHPAAAGVLAGAFGGVATDGVLQ